MTKPINLPTWATDANYAAGAETYSGTPTKVAPAALENTKGNVPAAFPAAQKFNWWQNLVYLWVSWLNGLFDLGGTYTGEAGGSSYLSGTALSTWFNTTAYIVGDQRTNAGNRYQCITSGTSAGSGGPTTTAADITDGTVHWKWIGKGDGRGLYFTSSVQYLTYSPESMNDHTGGTFDGFLALGASGTAAIPLVFPPGTVITHISPTYQGNGSADFTTRFVKTTGVSTNTLETITNTNPSVGWATGSSDITPSGSNGKIVVGFGYYIEFEVSGSGIQLGPVTIGYTYPGPS